VRGPRFPCRNIHAHAHWLILHPPPVCAPSAPAPNNGHCRSVFISRAAKRKALDIQTLLEGAAAPCFVDKRQNMRRDKSSTHEHDLAVSLSLKALEGRSSVPANVHPDDWRVLHLALSELGNPVLLLRDSRLFVEYGATSVVADLAPMDDGALQFEVVAPCSNVYCSGNAVVTIKMVSTDAGVQYYLAACTCRDWTFYGWFCVHFLIVMLRQLRGLRNPALAARVLASTIVSNDSFFHRAAKFQPEAPEVGSEPEAGPPSRALRWVPNAFKIKCDQLAYLGTGGLLDGTSDDDPESHPAPSRVKLNVGVLDGGAATTADITCLELLLEVAKSSMHSKKPFRDLVATKFNVAQRQHIGALCAAAGGTLVANPRKRWDGDVRESLTGFKSSSGSDEPSPVGVPSSSGSSSSEASSDGSGRTVSGSQLGLERLCSLVHFIASPGSAGIAGGIAGVSFV
jgi:hypothetical protein